MEQTKLLKDDNYAKVFTHVASHRFSIIGSFHLFLHPNMFTSNFELFSFNPLDSSGCLGIPELSAVISPGRLAVPIT